MRDGQQNKVEAGPIYPEIHNPTIEQLAALSIVYAANANPIPTRLTGVLPEGWITPPNVTIALQIKQSPDEPSEWFITHKVFSLMEQIAREQKENQTLAPTSV